MNVIYEIGTFLQQRFAEDRHRLEYLHRYGFPPSGRLAEYESTVQRAIMQATADLLHKEYLVKEALRYSPELSYGDNGEYAFETMLKVFALAYNSHWDYRVEWQIPSTTSPFSEAVLKVLMEQTPYPKMILGDDGSRTPPDSATQ